MKQHFTEDKKTALQAIEDAQKIAFAPIVFQAALALRDFGVLQILANQSKKGLTAREIHQQVPLSPYGLRVLLEAGLGIGLLTFINGQYHITKTGLYILNDEMTRANMDFVQDICYRGMHDLKGSILEGKPTGLKTLGPWATIYEGLSILPSQEQKSWFAFDHFYSSDSFPVVLPHVFAHKPGSILDIGGNTGKWALKCFEYDADVKVTIADLPGQVNLALANISAAGYGDRIQFYPVNLLDDLQPLPVGFDVIWMSQFLDCFSEDEIVSILKRCVPALNPGGKIFILEPFWDRQKFEVSAFCLQMTSLYFTNIANGNSQMYHSGLFASLVEKAGLRVTDCINNVGVSHSLMICEL